MSAGLGHRTSDSVRLVQWFCQRGNVEFRSSSWCVGRGFSINSECSTRAIFPWRQQTGSGCPDGLRCVQRLNLLSRPRTVAIHSEKMFATSEIQRSRLCDVELIRPLLNEIVLTFYCSKATIIGLCFYCSVTREKCQQLAAVAIISLLLIFYFNTASMLLWKPN